MSYVIDKICEENSITGYLSSRDIFPKSVQSDKSIYNCPIHSGDDTPSFFVYHKAGGEDFYCQGCKVGGNIINLISNIEDRTIKDVVSLFSKKMDISIDDHLALSIEKDLISSIEGGKEYTDQDVMVADLLYVSILIRDYIELSDLDEDEIDRCDKACEIVEKMAMSNNIDEFNEFIKKIPSILKRRKIIFDKNLMEKSMKTSYIWGSMDE